MVAKAGDVPELIAAVHEQRPDVAVIDIRTPPTFTDEGAQAAVQLRVERPDLAVLLFSQSLERRFATQLAQQNSDGFAMSTLSWIGGSNACRAREASAAASPVIGGPLFARGDGVASLRVDR